MFGKQKKQIIYMGSDHAGFEAKNKLKKFLESKGYDITDLGSFTEKPSDYPDIAREVGEKVSEHKESFGIIICGTGIGVAMAANKVRGIRAAQANNEHYAEMARRHNDANILTMGGRTTDFEDMKKIAMKFLNTDFEDKERHVRRVNKIEGKTTK